MTYKISFHGGPAGNHTHLGDYYRQLNEAGLPAFVKSVDHYGHCHELLELTKNTGKANIAVFRLSTRGQNDGFDYDVPMYHLAPKTAAGIHWQATVAKLPPEFSKECWIEPINEVDKNQADWLGHFAYEIGLLALGTGHKVALFGWSGGEPEYDHWKTAGMRKYFDLCAQHPDQLAVSLHEYSFTIEKLMDPEAYYLVGRFRQLIDACADMGVRCPKILITEFGWEYRNVPSPDVAMPQLLEAAKLYAAYPEVLLAAIWYLGGYFGDIHNQTQRLILPVIGQAKAFPTDPVPPPTPEPPPPDPDVPFRDRLWKMSVDRQVNHGIQLAPTAIQNRIRADGYHPVTDEVYFQGDPPWMAAEDWETRTKPRRVYWWEGGQVHFIEANQPAPPPAPKPEPPPPTGQVDLLPYFTPVTDGYGPLYEVRDPDGAQRRCQVQADAATQKFYLTKGSAGVGGRSEFEELAWDALWIWRGVDTSPGHGRFYVQYEIGKKMARWCPRFMSIGQEWSGGHYVQFFHKSDCSKSSQNSGPAMNHTKFFDRNPVTVNGLHFPDVVHIGRPGGEEFWFARGVGMIGWKSSWNQSWISELHAPGQRPDNIKESVCPFSL